MIPDPGGMRRLVSVSPYVPYAGVDHAGGDYLYEYLRAAHELGWLVTVICPATSETQRDALHRPAWLNLILSPRDVVSRPTMALRLLRNGVKAVPPGRWFRRLSSDARAAIASSDLIDLQWMGSVQYAPILRHNFPHVPIVATPHDVKSESVGRARTSPNLTVRVGARAALPAVIRVERAAMDVCNRVFVFKQTDIETLERLGVGAPARTTPPLIRLPADAPRADPSSPLLLFPAAFWRDENDEAARWFISDVWPRVTRMNNTARVRFAGSRPSAWLRAQASARVEVTGYVPNLLDSYIGVGIVVAPLRRGAGLKFKVAQAIGMGFPVIGTTVAFEGIDELTGRQVADRFDEADAFAGEVLNALNNLPQRVVEAQSTAQEVRDRLDFASGIRKQVSDYSSMLRPVDNP